MTGKEPRVAGGTGNGTAAGRIARIVARARGAGLHGAGIAFLANSMQQVATLAITLVAAGFLVPAEYGVYTLAIVFINLVQTLSYGGLYHYLVYASGEEKRLADTLFWTMLGFAIALSAVLFALAGPIADAFGAPHLEPVLQLLAVNQAFSALISWTSAMLMRQRRLTVLYAIILCENFLSLIIGVALLALWQSLYALVVYRFARTVIGLVLFAPAARLWPGLEVRRAIVVDAFRYAFGIYVSRFFQTVKDYSADIVLGLTFSTAEAAIYRIGDRLAFYPATMVAQPIQNFALMQFTGLAREGKPIGPLVLRFVGTLTLLLSVIAVLLALAIEPLVRLLFDPAYLAVVGVVLALTLRGVFSVGETLIEPVLAARGRTRTLGAFHGVWTLTQIVVVVLTAPIGMHAVAGAQAGVALLACALALGLIAATVGLGAGAIVRTAGLALLPAGVVALAGGLIMTLPADLAPGVMSETAAFALALAATGAVALVVLAVCARTGLLDTRLFVE